ncbi:MAG: hypothetical protein ABI361_02400 [Nitrososphaera sp.]|jgi:hypothetical protein
MAAPSDLEFIASQQILEVIIVSRAEMQYQFEGIKLSVISSIGFKNGDDAEFARVGLCFLDDDVDRRRLKAPQDLA